MGEGNFNPRSPRGERRCLILTMFARGRFQSTLPAWGATSILPPLTKQLLFQSTLPAWGATVSLIFALVADVISIHAPRVGSDHGQLLHVSAGGYFNPRSPRGERLYGIKHGDYSKEISIHAPRVGSDVDLSGKVDKETDFNPRSPRGERPVNPLLTAIS